MEELDLSPPPIEPKSKGRGWCKKTDGWYKNRRKPKVITKMGHVRQMGGKKHTSIGAPGGGGPNWRAKFSSNPGVSSGLGNCSTSFPRDEENPTPEELEEVRLRTLEVQSLWSPAERKLREPYDPDEQNRRSYLKCYRMHESAERVDGFTFEGLYRCDDLQDIIYDS